MAVDIPVLIRVVIKNTDYWREFSYPNLGAGIRFIGDTNNYHSLLIHKDDVQKFLTAYFEYQQIMLFGNTN